MNAPEEEQPLPVETTPDASLHTGSEHPIDPVDLAMAEGRDPTPANIERARKELEERGQAAIDEVTP
jgi:hypothetical protein